MKDITTARQKKKRIIWIVITLTVNLLIVGYIALREIRADADAVRPIPLSDIDWLFLAAGLMCFAVAVLAEYQKYKRLIITCEGRRMRGTAASCAMLGKYYDNVTPFGAGGQPFQIHFLRKRGLSVGSASAVPIAGFLSQQLALVIIALFVFILNGSAAAGAAVIRYAAYAGILLYLAVPAALLLFAFTPKPFKRFIGGAARFLQKLRILKDGGASAGRLFSSLDSYISNIRIILKRPFVSAAMLFLSLVYQTAVMSVPFFMIRAFGGRGDWVTVFSVTVYIYAAITVVPTPGNSGAAEGSFYAVFSALEGGALFWAMIAWRVIVYYSWLMIGIAVVMRTAVSCGRKKTPVPKDRPPRVALFIDIFYPNIDGVIKTVDSYAREINAAGGYACVFCPKSVRRYTDKFPYDVVRTPAFGIKKMNVSAGLPFTTVKAVKAFREKRFDVVHIHSPFGVGVIGVRLGNKFNIPVIATFHSKYYDDALNITHNRLAARLTANIVVDFFCSVDRTWACSKSTAETMRGYGYNGKIDVMENGVDALPGGVPSEMAERAASVLGIPKDKHILLFVGQQIWQKNLKTVLDATKIVTAARDDVVTVIVGAGYNGDEIKEYAKKTGVAEKVIFTGVISDRALLAGVYFLSSVFFFPSLYDNAPIVLREAAMAGVPALLASGSSAAEIVTDGFNGFTAENDAGAMARKLLGIIGTDELKAAGRAAKETIPVPWSVIVARAVEKYRED